MPVFLSGRFRAIFGLFLFQAFSSGFLQLHF